MAEDIELVIKIDKDIYEARQHWFANPKRMVDEVDIAIANGIVLPKGHGELVYREDVCNELRYMDNNGCITRSVNHVIEDIKKGVSTIIEADKEESEDKE